MSWECVVHSSKRERGYLKIYQVVKRVTAQEWKRVGSIGKREQDMQSSHEITISHLYNMKSFHRTKN